MVDVDLTDLDKSALRALRELGPCGTREISAALKRQHLDCNPGKAYRLLMRLTEAGKARHPKRCVWYAVGGRRPKVVLANARHLPIAGEP